MANDLFLKTANAVHRSILKASGGRIRSKVAKMPVLTLTTIGRKSGQRRSVLLTSPHKDGDTMVIVASKGGDDRHPEWFLNLQSNPEVEVRLPGRPNRPMTARVANSEERATLWPIVTAYYDGYAQYQTKTAREIPLVLLNPRD